MSLFGFLNINKPSGITSRDVVNQVQRLIRPVKVGHAGTLDPLATGVLVVCVGPATRLAQYVQQLPKRYRGTFLLGKTSDTEDIDGQVRELDNPPHPSREQLQIAAAGMVGTIDQVPPAFSALKVAGRRAHRMAREGKPPKMKPRPVVIHELEVTRFEYPEFELQVACGTGTYIRSLGRDLAQAVGTAAVMSQLERTAVGQFTVAEATVLDRVQADTLSRHLVPAAQGISHLTNVQLTEEELREIARGRSIANRFDCCDAEIAALNPAGQLAAILVPRRGGMGPTCNF